VIAVTVVRTVKTASFKDNIIISANQTPDWRATPRALVQGLVNAMKFFKNTTIATAIFIGWHSCPSCLQQKQSKQQYLKVTAGNCQEQISSSDGGGRRKAEAPLVTSFWFWFSERRDEGIRYKVCGF
jgi:hypothetical protein